MFRSTPRMESRGRRGRVKAAAIALGPLAVTPLLVILIADGPIGSSEKSLIWMIPWVLWSIIFASCMLVLRRSHWIMRRAVIRSALVATAGVAGALVLLAVFGQLGIAGRM